MKFIQVHTKKMFVFAVSVFFTQTTFSQNTQEVFQGKIGKTLADSKEWWSAKPQAPKNAPNIVYLLIDDAGFGTSSAFGGLMHTPTLDSLANNGLRYTHVLCVDT
eukprot:Opistho-1_new@37090